MEIEIKNHYRIEFFNQFSLSLRYDSVASTFGFSYYFDPKDATHRNMFNPGHYHLIKIKHDGETLLTGTMLSAAFKSSAIKQLAGCSGYSLPGVLEDCQVPTELYPLQSDGKTLKEIADRMTSLFPFSVSISSSVADLMGETYDTTTTKEDQTIKEYLGSLASQKNIILSHTQGGNLLFTKPNTNILPIFNLSGDTVGVVNMSLSFNGQGMHSSISVLKQASIDTDNAGEGVIINPFVPYAFRPFVKIQSSGNDNDSNKAARNVLSTEMKKISLKIQLNTWYLNGKFIKPNNIITVQNEDIFLFKRSRWFIESIDYSQNSNDTGAVLTCVLPEVYNDNTPTNIFELHD